VTHQPNVHSHHQRQVARQLGVPRATGREPSGFKTRLVLDAKSRQGLGSQPVADRTEDARQRSRAETTTVNVIHRSSSSREPVGGTIKDHRRVERQPARVLNNNSSTIIDAGTRISRRYSRPMRTTTAAAMEVWAINHSLSDSKHNELRHRRHRHVVDVIFVDEKDVIQSFMLTVASILSRQ